MLCFLVPAPLRPCLPVNKQWKVVCWFYDPVVNDSMHKYEYSQQHRYKTDTGHMCVYTFTAIRWIEKSIENMWPEINSIENKSLPVPLLSMAGWSKRNMLQSELMTINRRMNKLVQNSWLDSMDRWMNEALTYAMWCFHDGIQMRTAGCIVYIIGWLGVDGKGFASKQLWNNTTTINWRCVKVYCVPIQLI